MSLCPRHDRSILCLTLTLATDSLQTLCACSDRRLDRTLTLMLALGCAESVRGTSLNSKHGLGLSKMSYCSANILLFGEVAEGNVLFHFAGDTDSCGESLPYHTVSLFFVLFFYNTETFNIGKTTDFTVSVAFFLLSSNETDSPWFRVETCFTVFVFTPNV